jgi:hypothetical protein
MMSDSSLRAEPEEQIARESGRVLRALRFADLMALMMVAATAFSAFATWRTATIAEAIYDASERAYIGVESVIFDSTRPHDPRVIVNYKNFGNIAAQGTDVACRVLIDGKPITAASAAKHAGILSPTAPHHLHIHIPPQYYPAITTGKSRLDVAFALSYAGALNKRLCYLEGFSYLAEEQQFEINGGTTDCAAQHGLWPANFQVDQ